MSEINIYEAIEDDLLNQAEEKVRTTAWALELMQEVNDHLESKMISMNNCKRN